MSPGCHVCLSALIWWHCDRPLAGLLPSISMLNTCHVGPRIFWRNQIWTVAAYALSFGIVKSSTAVILIYKAFYYVFNEVKHRSCVRNCALETGCKLISPIFKSISCCKILIYVFNTLRPRQNGRHFADDTFKRIFLKENVRIFIKISLKFVPKSRIDNIPALFQIMAWHRPGDKPLSEAMIVSLLTHICVARPQWVDELAIQYPYITSQNYPLGSYFVLCFVVYFYG